MEIAGLKDLYKKLKPDIKKRLKEFESVRKAEDSSGVYSELCFCLLTPQSKAKKCWSAIDRLKEKDLLYKGKPPQLSKYLKEVRFRNNKARYLAGVRELFSEIEHKINNVGILVLLVKFINNGLEHIESSRSCGGECEIEIGFQFVDKCWGQFGAPTLKHNILKSLDPILVLINEVFSLMFSGVGCNVNNNVTEDRHIR